jgi:acyl-CoA synthetase (AMP-forming)/AMP-acid ligase II
MNNHENKAVTIWSTFPAAQCPTVRPVLFVSTYPGATPGVDALDAYLRGQLSKHKLPVQITVMETPPRNPVGKIDRAGLP